MKGFIYVILAAIAALLTCVFASVLGVGMLWLIWEGSLAAYRWAGWWGVWGYLLTIISFLWILPDVVRHARARAEKD